MQWLFYDLKIKEVFFNFEFLFSNAVVGFAGISSSSIEAEANSTKQGCITTINKNTLYSERLP
jgi:hypothetical protein